MEGRDAGNEESEGQDQSLSQQRKSFCKKNKDFYTIEIGNPSKHCGAQSLAVTAVGAWARRWWRETEGNLYPVGFDEMVKNKAKPKEKKNAFAVNF